MVHPPTIALRPQQWVLPVSVTLKYRYVFSTHSKPTFSVSVATITDLASSFINSSLTPGHKFVTIIPTETSSGDGLRSFKIFYFHNYPSSQPNLCNCVYGNRLGLDCCTENTLSCSHSRRCRWSATSYWVILVFWTHRRQECWSVLLVSLLSVTRWQRTPTFAVGVSLLCFLSEHNVGKGMNFPCFGMNFPYFLCLSTS